MGSLSVDCIALTCSVAGIVNAIGLGLDIIGVVLIFRYGIGPDVRRGGAGYLVLSRNEEEIRKARRYDCLGRSGLLLIIAGFAIQMISNFV